MAQAAREAGVAIVTGDTKVVERGKGDGVFITTTGVGVVPEGVDISGDRAGRGQGAAVGAIGDHGVGDHGIPREPVLRDQHPLRHASLHGLVAAMVARVPGIGCLRDPTARLAPP